MKSNPDSYEVHHASCSRGERAVRIKCIADGEVLYTPWFTSPDQIRSLAESLRRAMAALSAPLSEVARLGFVDAFEALEKAEQEVKENLTVKKDQL